MVIGSNPTLVRIYKFLVIASTLQIHIIIISSSIIKNFQSEKHFNIHVLYIARTAGRCLNIKGFIIKRVDRTQISLKFGKITGVLRKELHEFLI